MISNRSTVNLQEKKGAAVNKRTQQTPLHLMSYRQDSGHNNYSLREIVALTVDRIADHGQKEVNLKTRKVQPCEQDLFFCEILSDRSINYWRHVIPIQSTEKSWPQKRNYLQFREWQLW